MVFRFFAVLMTGLFAWSIYLQTNDPDPLVWIILYGLPMVLTALTLFNQGSIASNIIVIVFYLVFIVITYPARITGPLVDNEEFREAGGLAICVAWLVFITARHWWQSR